MRTIGAFAVMAPTWQSVPTWAVHWAKSSSRKERTGNSRTSARPVPRAEEEGRFRARSVLAVCSADDQIEIVDLNEVLS